MKRRVALAHQSVVWGDAIGNDIVGMYRLLEALGFEPVIVGEVHRHQFADLATIAAKDAELSSCSLLIYHHSQFWATGETLLEGVECPVIFRYHNITPPHFFAPYSARYASLCEDGRRLTRQLAGFGGAHLWLADSKFNASDLVANGVDSGNIVVSPPFNRIHNMLRLPRLACYDGKVIDILFVGRLAPNKGHRHLLRVVHALTGELGYCARLRIVGAIDPELDGYHRDLRTMIAELQLEPCVELLPHCSERELETLFQTAHFFACFSEHEGFCVPIIEAQAIGLPVVGAATTAVGETAGLNQLMNVLPLGSSDYSFYARLIVEAFENANLRATVANIGERNVRERFSEEPIENGFTDAVFRTLGLL